MLQRAYAAAVGHADDHRHVEAALRAVAVARGMVLDLVEALEGEAGELDLAHRLETVERHADGGPDDPGLREGAVDHPPAAEAPVQVLRHAKDTAIDTHVLADHDDIRIPLH